MVTSLKWLLQKQQQQHVMYWRKVTCLARCQADRMKPSPTNVSGPQMQHLQPYCFCCFDGKRPQIEQFQIQHHCDSCMPSFVKKWWREVTKTMVIYWTKSGSEQPSRCQQMKTLQRFQLKFFRFYLSSPAVHQPYVIQINPVLKHLSAALDSQQRPTVTLSRDLQ